jgi:hypothetical protein
MSEVCNHLNSVITPPPPLSVLAAAQRMNT